MQKCMQENKNYLGQGTHNTCSKTKENHWQRLQKYEKPLMNILLLIPWLTIKATRNYGYVSICNLNIYNPYIWQFDFLQNYRLRIFILRNSSSVIPTAPMVDPTCFSMTLWYHMMLAACEAHSDSLKWTKLKPLKLKPHTWHVFSNRLFTMCCWLAMWRAAVWIAIKPITFTRTQKWYECTLHWTKAIREQIFTSVSESELLFVSESLRLLLVLDSHHD